jgi:hypothetical protein
MERERSAAVYLVAAPLRDAAADLGARIDNLRGGGLLSYTEAGNPRSGIVMLGTAYRFARFFAMLEMVYDRPAVLSLEGVSESMEPIVDILGDIGRTFASDRYGERLMIWREEQRAMAQLVRKQDGDGMIGFATFTAIATGGGARWFSNLITDLESDVVVTSERLALIQSLLARLL